MSVTVELSVSGLGASQNAMVSLGLGPVLNAPVWEPMRI